ncbi:uncharacterized protein MONBRDRAFT_16206, partial [Monosiga brevicollis MX1]
LSPLVRQVDFALDWMHLDAGERLYQQNDPSDVVYLLLSGRVRSVITRPDGSKAIMREYGRHELVGELEVLTETPRATTIHAVRDAELAKIPAGLLHLVKHKHPHVATHLMRMLSERLLGLVKGVELESTDPNLTTVALLPTSPTVPLSLFAERLRRALGLYGETLHLNAAIVKEQFGMHPCTIRGSQEYSFVRWLASQEDRHSVVLYEADYELNDWTRRCIRQADCVLIVGVGHETPSVGPAESELENVAAKAQKELVLLHRDDTFMPKRTADWLNARTWCSRHHHIRCDDDILPKEKTLNRKRQPRPIGPSRFTLIERSDFGRLARHLSGHSIGLVLGGGGARGAAELGVIKQLEEAGIPIDIVGGTSIGSLMAALYAEELNYADMKQRFDDFTTTMGSQVNMALDLTYPVVAMFSGRAFNRVIEDLFGNRQIEDLWLPFFCVTTDITASKKKVHSYGSLWRYVRASMSLSGYLPPLCDPEDGHMLLDGGYVDVLPIEVMRQHGATYMFAVDVSAKDLNDYENFGDEISGFWLLFQRLNPFVSKPKIPHMEDIASKLAFIASDNYLNEVASTYCDLDTFFFFFFFFFCVVLMLMAHALVFVARTSQ